jgi:hypothetical protein
MYQLELTTEQAKVVIAALDAYSRIHMGQIGIVAEIMTEGSYDSEDLADVRGLCSDIKEAVGLPTNGSYGIFHPKVPPQAKVSWDIVCVLRQVVARAENHGSHSVWHQDPMHCEKSVPLAKCRFEDQPDLDMGTQNIS